MSSAQVWSGVTQGLANVQQYRSEKPLRDARLAEAKMNQELSREKLAEFRDAKPLRQSRQDLAIAQAQEDLKVMQATALKTDTYAAFDKYEENKDIKYLNNFLQSAKKNPVGQKVYQNTVRVDPLTRTPKNEAMLAQRGITDIDGYFTDPSVANFVVATDPAGNQHLLDVDNMYIQSGYTAYASNRATTAMQARSQKQQLAKTGMLYKDMDSTMRTANILKDQLKITLPEALDMLKKGSTKAGSSSIERIADKLREDNPGMTYAESIEKATQMTKKSSGSTLERETAAVMKENPGMSREEAMAAAKERIQPSTSAEKNLDASDEVTVQLNEAAGGDFFAADMSSRETRRKVGPLITKLEKLTGSSLSNEDKRMARNFRELTHLGDISSELTDEQTGVFDNLLHGVKQYLSDNVTGVAATTAYETIRNAVRHDLFGATLPAGEIRAFNKSMGSLGKQTGPVLKQLQMSMHGVKSKLQTIYDMNDERIAQYYLGSSLEDIDRVIERIDQRIREVSNVDSKPLSHKDVQQPVGNFQSQSPEEQTKTLNAIFDGSNF